MGQYFMMMLMSNPSHGGRGAEARKNIALLLDELVWQATKNRNAIEQGRELEKIQQSGRYSVGADAVEALKKIGYNEWSVVIIRPQKKFGTSAIATAELEQVPSAKIRSSSTGCLGTTAKQKRAQSVKTKGSASDRASASKSKRKSLEDLFEQYKKEFRENQQKRKEDSSLLKLLSPLQHQYCHRKGFEEAAWTGLPSSPLPPTFKKPLSSEESSKN